MFLFSKDEDSPRLKQLRALSLFSTLSPRELKTADNLLHERSYLQGEVIFDQGEEGQALYIIETGKVLICRQGQQAEG
ncbi:MAG: cyclic nucleotide-binding domain-containing protein, partial [Rhodocyclaceae bacterium]|nr:cyclic nucleotide-binding domain-containing protein [Rhodocyclaceae bacterium]